MNASSLEFSVALPLAVAFALGLAGCVQSPEGAPDAAHSSRNALDWAGTYRGVLPCADCPGIETVLTLSQDGRYVSRMRYLGRGDQVFTTEGRFEWSAGGDAITLTGDQPLRYKVGENRLTQLSLDGSPITGALADHYVLARTGGLVGTYWKLVELRGQPVPALPRAPWLLLETEDMRASGFGGCNGFGGTYTLDEAALRVRFGQMISTMKACPEGMDVERGLSDVLEQVDNYSLSDTHLSLNRARMAPLARFEAVPLPD